MWGLTWWPLKEFAAEGLSGPLLAMLTYGFAGLLGIAVLVVQRKALQSHALMWLLIALVGGWGNTAFVSAMVIGDVVRVMLLFYLAPVWSVLGGRLFLGEHVSPRRGLAVVLSLAGAFLVVGSMTAFSTAPGAADVLAVTAGLAFSGNNILAHKAQGIPTASKSVAVLLGCGFTSWVMLAALAALDGAADSAVQRQALSSSHFSPALLLALAAFSLLWMGLVTYTWQWSVTRLEAGRSGIIAIAELVVAVVSATLWGAGAMSANEAMGGALIVLAAVLEATDGTSAEPASIGALAANTHAHQPRKPFPHTPQ